MECCGSNCQLCSTFILSFSEPTSFSWYIAVQNKDYVSQPSWSPEEVRWLVLADRMWVQGLLGNLSDPFEKLVCALCLLFLVYLFLHPSAWNTVMVTRALATTLDHENKGLLEGCGHRVLEDFWFCEDFMDQSWLPWCCTAYLWTLTYKSHHFGSWFLTNESNPSCNTCIYI